RSCRVRASAERDPDETSAERDPDEKGTIMSTAEYWDGRYGSQERMWSGRANDALVELAGGLTPGRALDLGSGEGADSIWLAQQGWSVTGIDISTVAVERATAVARELGLDSARIRFRTADLSALAEHGALST